MDAIFSLLRYVANEVTGLRRKYLRCTSFSSMNDWVAFIFTPSPVDCESRRVVDDAINLAGERTRRGRFHVLNHLSGLDLLLFIFIEVKISLYFLTMKNSFSEMMSRTSPSSNWRISSGRSGRSKPSVSSVPLAKLWVTRIIASGCLSARAMTSDGV